MTIEGVWEVNYRAAEGDGDADEKGVVVVQDGLVMGRDPWGGQYKGTYTIEGSIINVTVDVSEYQADSEPILPGRSYPFRLVLRGEYHGPAFFSLTGYVEDPENHGEVEFVANLQRIF